MDIKPKIFKTERMLRCADWLATQACKGGSDDSTIIEESSSPPTEDEKPQDDIMSMPTAVDEDKFEPMTVPRNKLRTLGLRLECEWLGCLFVSDEPTKFQRHVSSHIPHLVTTPPPNPQYKCMWDVCHHKSSDGSEMVRHVKYHAYHARLMAIGASVVFNMKLPECKKESVGRNKIPVQKSDYVCRWVECKRTFNDVEDYFQHVNAHLQTGPEACAWAGCGVLSQALPVHLRTHSAEKWVACPHCGIHFANYNKMVEHRQRQGTSSKPALSCTVCGKQQATHKLLRLHARAHVCVYACSYCDMTTPTLSALSLHIRYRHLSHRAGGRPFRCDLCQYASVTKQDLARHMVIHSKKEKSKAKKPASDDGDSKNPDKRRSTKKYICHMCPRSTAKVFSRGTRLTSHLVKNHGAQWPDGHCRFRYQQSDDGYYRLTTTRYESLEVSRQIMNGANNLSDPIDEQLSIKVKRKANATTDTPAIFEVSVVKGEEPDEVDEDEVAVDDDEVSNSIDEVLVEKIEVEKIEPEEEVVEGGRRETNIEITMCDVDDEGNIISSTVMDPSEVIIGI